MMPNREPRHIAVEDIDLVDGGGAGRGMFLGHGRRSHTGCGDAEHGADDGQRGEIRYHRFRRRRRWEIPQYRGDSKAIDRAAGAGGGIVVVPAGTFVTGRDLLKPGMGLDVEKDGVLKGSTNIADYPQRLTRIEGHFQQWLPALVNADGVDHLRIGGAGTLDGSGTPFYAAFQTSAAPNPRRRIWMFPGRGWCISPTARM